jgi:hypothetical protein
MIWMREGETNQIGSNGLINYKKDHIVISSMIENLEYDYEMNYL